MLKIVAFCLFCGIISLSVEQITGIFNNHNNKRGNKMDVLTVMNVVYVGIFVLFAWIGKP